MRSSIEIESGLFFVIRNFRLDFFGWLSSAEDLKLIDKRGSP